MGCIRLWLHCAFACPQLAASVTGERAVTRSYTPPIPLHSFCPQAGNPERAAGVPLFRTQAHLRPREIVCNPYSSSRCLFSFKAPGLLALVDALGRGPWPAAWGPKGDARTPLTTRAWALGPAEDSQAKDPRGQGRRLLAEKPRRGSEWGWRSGARPARSESWRRLAPAGGSAAATR